MAFGLRFPGAEILSLPGRIRIPLRLRVFFRGTFLLLALATLALALGLLQDEKQRGWRAYQDGLAKTQAQIVARLRHPAGQLALLNPGSRGGSAGAALRPLVLPFASIDFDDRVKAQQAVEMAGCQVQYGDGAKLCLAVGNSAMAGAFLYAVGSFGSEGPLIARRLGSADLAQAHRLKVSVTLRGQTTQWLAPLEAGAEGGPATRGRLAGFAEDPQGLLGTRPVRDFRGWWWQDARCLGEGEQPAVADTAGCRHLSFFSVRLPVELFREELMAQRERLAWPPPDLDRVQVRVQALAGGSDQPLFDSDQPDATPPFSLADLAPLLLPGETLRIRKAGAPAGAEIATLTGSVDKSQPTSPLLDRLIRQLPVEGYDRPIQIDDSIATPLGRYELQLSGDLRGVNRALSLVAARVAGYVGAMLAAIVLTWAAIELAMMRRITLLTKRAAAVSQGLREGDLVLDVSGLRGSDELGLLAGTLAELMQRVNDAVRREHIRAQQEKDQWHAVGHEIMSPLQSLMVLHPKADDASHRYIQRMQQAVRVLYGQASPSEAFEATTLGLDALDLDAFLAEVAANAPHAGVEQVVYTPLGQPVPVQADAYALEDAVTHILSNAQRYRPPGTSISLTLALEGDAAELRIHNDGPPIATEQLERIFEYGVSSQHEGSGDRPDQRGQGLFVVRTYLAKMGGTVRAQNDIGAPGEAGGVSFVLRLARAKLH